MHCCTVESESLLVVVPDEDGQDPAEDRSEDGYQRTAQRPCTDPRASLYQEIECRCLTIS